MNINKGKVAFLTLGCKVNSYETNAMETLFQKSGYEIVNFSEEADIYIVNTCTVTNMADRKSRQMLHKAKKKNPNSIQTKSPMQHSMGDFFQIDTYSFM